MRPYSSNRRATNASGWALPLALPSIAEELVEPDRASVAGTPRFDHAVVEYAGNGEGCTGADYETALDVPPSAVVTNSTFRNIAGTAILSTDCNIPDWCENMFEGVRVGPLACDIGQQPTACP